MQNSFAQGKPREEPYQIRGLNLPVWLDKEIENYRFENRHKTYTGAVIELIEKGLKNHSEVQR